MEKTAIKTARVSGAAPVIATALAGALIFLATIAFPQLSGPGLHAHDGHLSTILVHLVGGSIMLVAGAIALWIGFTGQFRRWHKPVGYTYLVGGTPGAIAGMVASFGTPHAIGLSTFTLGLVWMGATGMAVRAAWNRRFDQHRAWMVRSYSVAWAAVLFRIWTHLLPANLQFPPTDMLWTSWVLPLFVAELLLQWRPGAHA